MVLLQKPRHPEKIKPPERIRQKLRDRKRPRLSMSQQFHPRNSFRAFHRRVGKNVRPLPRRKPPMFLRRIIKNQPQHQPHRPDRSRDRKRPRPPHRHRHQRHQVRRRQRPDVRPGLNERRCGERRCVRLHHRLPELPAGRVARLRRNERILAAGRGSRRAREPVAP